MAYQDSIPQATLAAQVAAYFATIAGYDNTSADQVLTHSDGVLTWVTGVSSTHTLNELSTITTVAGVVTETASV